MVFYWSSGLIRWGGFSGCSQVLNLYKDEISHKFTNVRWNELSDVCVICKELGIIGKWFLETEM